MRGHLKGKKTAVFSPYGEDTGAVVLEVKHVHKVKTNLVHAGVGVVQAPWVTVFLALEDGIQTLGLVGAVVGAWVTGISLLAPRFCPRGVCEHALLDDAFGPKVVERLQEKQQCSN